MTQNADWICRSLFALSAIIACGCPKTGAPPIAEQKTPLVKEITQVGTAATATEEVPAEHNHSPAPTEVDKSATAVSTASSKEQLAPPESKERILLLAPSRAAIIDFVLSIDDRPHTEALTRLVEDVLKLADLDGDGRTMWKELCACERVKYGQFGNLPIDGDNAEKQIVERYDVARDGVVDRFELPRFLTRNAGGSRPFSIRGTLDHRGSNRNLAATWQTLDENQDGTIDSTEQKAAAAKLAAKDTDDNEIVTMTEVNPQPPTTPDPEMMMASRRRRGPDAAKPLGEHADWIAVQRALEGQYGSVLQKGDRSPFSAPLFDLLDVNRDGRLTHNEIKRLNEVPAQIVVEIAFGPTDDDRTPEDGKPETNQIRNQPRLTLRHELTDTSEKSRPIDDQPGRLTISLGDSVLTFVTNDTVARANFAARAKQALEMFDQNKDGYLEPNELPESLQGQLGRFEAVDVDGDGKAYPKEIEEFLSQQQAGLRAQIHARATDSEDLLFLALDLSHDQRLDSREIQYAGERLAELDTSGDGQLTPDELPETLTIVLARGSIETPDATFVIPPASQPERKEKAPRWFTAMDANADGVISRREFLGSAEQFERLDRDGSGLLEMSEVASGE